VPITWDEPEHSHEEHWEPAQEVTGEARATGKGDSNRPKPILVVSNKAANYLQCFNHNGRLLNSSVGDPQGRRPEIPISIKEGFASSFRPRGYDYFFKLREARKVTGTRIRLQFDNVGHGVNLFVPVSVPLTVSARNPMPTNAQQAKVRGATTACLQLVATDPKTGVSPPDFADVRAAEPGQLAQLTVSGRTAYATYEVLKSDPNAVHEAIIGAHVAFISNTNQNLPEVGVTTIRTGFAPGPDVLVTDSIPRNLFSINFCTCGLLFPFVTNQDGLDTRIVVANTSLDPFGSTPQKGPVTFSFYGTTPDGQTPPLVKTQPIPGGEQLVFSLSGGGNFGVPPVPGFEGYIFAVACFQYCHALALISDASGGLAQSYLAVRIPSKSGYPVPTVD
jgi:hypothetical protein